MNTNAGNPSEFSFNLNLLGNSPDSRFYDEHPEEIKSYIDQIARALLDPDNGHALVLGFQSVGKSFLIEQFASNVDQFLGNSNLETLHLVEVFRSDANIIEAMPNGIPRYVQAMADALGCDQDSICLVTESPDFAAAAYAHDRRIKIILELNISTFVQLNQHEQQGVSKIWSSWGIVDTNEIFVKRDELVDSLVSIMGPKMAESNIYNFSSDEIGAFVDFIIESMPDLEYVSEEKEENDVLLAPPGIWGFAVRRLASNLAFSSSKKHLHEDGSKNLDVVFEETLNEVRDDFESFLEMLENGDDAFTALAPFNMENAMVRVFQMGNESSLNEEQKDETPLVFSSNKDLGKRLRKTVLGQDSAVDAVANSLAVPAAGIHDETKPVRSFMFLGPTGVGKTQLALSLADQLATEPMNVIRLDMSEYAQAHEASKLLGAPSGYVGYEEGGILTNAVFKNPKSLILLDEVEKAHHKIWDSFLQIFDAGRMTDNKGREIDFSQTVIVMTSNLGAKETSNGDLGFFVGADRDAKAQLAVQKKVEDFFRPEFVNRIDEFVYFTPLSMDIARQIVRREITLVSDRMKPNGFKLSNFEDNVVDEIIKKSAFTKYGARDIQRAVFKNISQPLALRMLNKSQRAKTIKLSLDTDNEILVK